MYKIEEDNPKEKYTILIPATLDAHFPLLKYMFYSKRYRPVILDETGAEVIRNGLLYTNNDMCYPLILIIGQLITAIKSGIYNSEKTVCMIPQGGDACRGSNYIHIIRKALKLAGFENVPVLSLNIKGFEKKHRLPISLGMAFRAVAGAMYGDILMILKNQTEPYEINKGETELLVGKWTKKLRGDIVSGKHLGLKSIEKKFSLIASDFAGIKVDRSRIDIKRVGIVGEMYVKYCALGNRSLEKYLREQKCEYYINGFTWYALYYIDSHMAREGGIMKCVYKTALKFFCGIQKKMIDEIRKTGFYCMDGFHDFKKNAAGAVTYRCGIADGWLMGAEIANNVKIGFNKVLCIQPFGCLPNQVCGKGIYPYLQRNIENLKLVSIDYDTSGSDVNVKNRIKLLLDTE